MTPTFVVQNPPHSVLSDTFCVKSLYFYCFYLSLYSSFLFAMFTTPSRFFLYHDVITLWRHNKRNISPWDSTTHSLKTPFLSSFYVLFLSPPFCFYFFTPIIWTHLHALSLSNIRSITLSLSLSIENFSIKKKLYCEKKELFLWNEWKDATFRSNVAFNKFWTVLVHYCPPARLIGPLDLNQHPARQGTILFHPSVGFRAKWG